MIQLGVSRTVLDALGDPTTITATGTGGETLGLLLQRLDTVAATLASCCPSCGADVGSEHAEGCSKKGRP